MVDCIAMSCVYESRNFNAPFRSKFPGFIGKLGNKPKQISTCPRSTGREDGECSLLPLLLPLCDAEDELAAASNSTPTKAVTFARASGGWIGDSTMELDDGSCS